MRISRRLGGLVGALVMLGAALAAPGASAAQSYRSLDDALANGINAYAGGFYELAIPALEAAAEGGLDARGVRAHELRRLTAHFFLGRIYMDNSSSRTDHARAYRIYQLIVDEHGGADLDDPVRAPYVAKSMTALGVYLLNGVPAARVPRNPVLAAQYFHQAATVFNDEDAQFELAKLQLRGEGVPEDPASAKHWLSVLTRKGHAGAQAFLADLLWRGKYMAKDANLALALITRAVVNAPPQERIWIEDIYQNIYCGASVGIRKQADGIVANWGRQFTRSAAPSERDSLYLQPSAERSCSNGEPVRALREGFVGQPSPTTSATTASTSRDTGSQPSISAGAVSAGEFSAGAAQGAPAFGFMGAGAAGSPSRR